MPRCAQNNDYLVTANVDARNVGLHQGTTQLTGIALDSAVTADPHRIELAGVRLAALGGSFTGSAAIQEMQQFHVAGNLHNFDIDQLTRTFMAKPLGYDGVVSGPVTADGDLKNTNADRRARQPRHRSRTPRRAGLRQAERRLQRPRRHGHCSAQSFLQLPHTRVDLSGSLGQQIQARIVSRDLADLRPIAGNLPVALNNGGSAVVNATITGKLSAPRVAAHAELTNFAVEDRTFTRFAADLNASAGGAAAQQRRPLARRAPGELSAAPSRSATGSPRTSTPSSSTPPMRNADLADVLALAGPAGYPRHRRAHRRRAHRPAPSAAPPARPTSPSSTGPSKASTSTASPPAPS